MKYKIILFDLDDTLIDFAASQRASLTDVHQAFYPEIAFDTLESRFKEINHALWQRLPLVTVDDIRRMRFEKLNQALDYHPTVKDVAHHYETALDTHGHWFPEVEDAITDLHAAGYVMGIITNGFAKVQRVKFQKLKMHQWFDCLIISDEVQLSKPDKAIFECATKALATKHGEAISTLAPESILMVGDSLQNDGQGAHNAGFDFCWIAHSTAQNRQDIPITHHHSSVAALAQSLLQDAPNASA